MSEYVSDIPCANSSYLLQLDDCEKENIFPTTEFDFNELVLDKRPGRKYHMYGRQCNIDKLSRYVKSLKGNPEQLQI